MRGDGGEGGVGVPLEGLPLDQLLQPLPTSLPLPLHRLARLLHLLMYRHIGNSKRLKWQRSKADLRLFVPNLFGGIVTGLCHFVGHLRESLEIRLPSLHLRLETAVLFVQQFRSLKWKSFPTLSSETQQAACVTHAPAGRGPAAPSSSRPSPPASSRLGPSPETFTSQ